MNWFEVFPFKKVQQEGKMEEKKRNTGGKNKVNGPGKPNERGNKPMLGFMP